MAPSNKCGTGYLKFGRGLDDLDVFFSNFLCAPILTTYFFSCSGVLVGVRVEVLGVDLGRSRSHKKVIKTEN